MTPPLPVDAYRERLARHDAEAAAEAARSRRYSRWRVLTAAIILAAIIGVVRTGAVWPGGGVALLAVTCFLWLVARHDRVERRRAAAVALATLNRDALARLARRWNDLPPPWRAVVRDDHPYAADLDIFGRASLVQVLGPVRTPQGRRALSQWLLEPTASDNASIAARQDAVRELAPRLDWRQQLSVRVRHVATGDVGPLPDDCPHVVRWAEAPDALAARPWLPAVAIILTAISLAGAIGAFTGVVTGYWWLLAGLLGWILRWLVREPLEHSLGGAAGEHGLRPWSEAIDLVHGASFVAPALTAARAELADSGGAPRALRTLEQLVALSDVRHSAWLFVPLQTLVLWDLHAWFAIERWRRRHGRHVRRWLETIGAVEAIAGLASLSFDHAGWAIPVFDGSASRVEGRGVGHPLLAADVRVVNDIAVGPPGRFLLITGSNMSGKSTLLRAIGLNIVLAHAGGPVCAAQLHLPRLSLHTSMRVNDSLERGLSLFMASLLRLQQIVVAARHATPQERTCYLLDEALQGTNSVERQIAVRTVMGHLTRCEAIGAMTTHDLQLAHDDAFAAHADSFHLQETLVDSGGEVTMTFDYRLRPGPAQAGNAMHLVRLLGLAGQ